MIICYFRSRSSEGLGRARGVGLGLPGHLQDRSRGLFSVRRQKNFWSSKISLSPKKVHENFWSPQGLRGRFPVAQECVMTGNMTGTRFGVGQFSWTLAGQTPLGQVDPGPRTPSQSSYLRKTCPPG